VWDFFYFPLHPPTSWFLEDLSNLASSLAFFFFFSFLLLFFCEQRVGTDHLLVAVLSAAIALWDVFSVCVFGGFCSYGFPYFERKLSAALCRQID